MAALPDDGIQGDLVPDIAEKEVLVFYEGDDVHPWHHRILLRRLEGSSWIVATPTHDAFQEDLGEAEDFRILVSGEAFPRDCQNPFCFQRLDSQALDRLRYRAREIDTVLGYPTDHEAKLHAEAKWILSDPALEDFGSEVPDDVLGSGEKMVTRGSAALVHVINSDGIREWTTAQRVRGKDVADWLNEKRSGFGRDSRLSATLCRVGPNLLQAAMSSRFERR